MGLSQSENIKEEIKLINKQNAMINHYKSLSTSNKKEDNNQLKIDISGINSRVLNYVIHCISNCLPLSDDLLMIVWHCFVVAVNEVIFDC